MFDFRNSKIKGLSKEIIEKAAVPLERMLEMAKREQMQ